MVVCGGVNAVLTPTIFMQLSRARMVSRTGQCQAFSADADGYARGEGCGIVLLKRLSDVRTNRRIYKTFRAKYQNSLFKFLPLLFLIIDL